MYPYPLSSDFEDRKNSVRLERVEDDGNHTSWCARFTDPDFLSKDNLIWQFFRASSLHGFKYVAMWERGTIERIFWAFGILGCMGFSIYLIHIGVVIPLTATPVLISFQSSDITIDQIPFPAITICDVNKIRRSEVEVLERRVDNWYGSGCTNQNDSSEECKNLYTDAYVAVVGLQYLGNICNRILSFAKSFGFSAQIGGVRYGFAKNNTYANSTLSTNEGNEGYRQYIQPILQKALTNCTEMILRCRFQDSPFPCQDLFSAVPSEFGMCCVFNMVPQSVLRNWNKSHPLARRHGINETILEAWRRWDIDNGLVKQSGDRQGLDYPKHQQKAGMNTGLSILLDTRMDQYHCSAHDSKGFRILAHSPIESPHVLEFGKGVQPNTETFVGLKAEITVMDKSVRTMSLEKRDCYLQGEFPLKTSTFYTEMNCLDECIANFTYERCGCLRYYQPNQGSRDLCPDLRDTCVIEALIEVEEKGVLKICPLCYPSCTDVQYYMETNWLPMRSDVNLWRNSTSGSTEDWSNATLSVVHFYFSSDYVESRVRKSLYGFRQVMANAGGLLGLAIGFSIISIVEPLYFLTIRYFLEIKQSSESETNISSSLVSSKQPLKISCRPQPLGYLP